MVTSLPLLGFLTPQMCPVRYTEVSVTTYHVTQRNMRKSKNKILQSVDTILFLNFLCLINVSAFFLLRPSSN